MGQTIQSTGIYAALNERFNGFRFDTVSGLAFSAYMERAMELLANHYSIIAKHQFEKSGIDYKLYLADMVKIRPASPKSQDVLRLFLYSREEVIRNMISVTHFISHIGYKLSPFGGMNKSREEIMERYGEILCRYDDFTSNEEINTFTDLIHVATSKVPLQLLIAIEDFARVFGFYPRVSCDIAIVFLDMVLQNTEQKEIQELNNIIERDIQSGYWKNLLKDKTATRSGIFSNVHFYLKDYYGYEKDKRNKSGESIVEFTPECEQCEDLVDVYYRVMQEEVKVNPEILKSFGVDLEVVKENHEKEKVMSEENKIKEGENMENKEEIKGEGMNCDQDKRSEEKVESPKSEEEKKEGKSDTNYLGIGLGFVAGAIVGAGLFYLGRKLYEEKIDIVTLDNSENFVGVIVE